MKINIQDHMLVPKHEIMTEEEISDEFSAVDYDFKDLPKIKSAKKEAQEVDRKRIRQHTIAGTLFALAAVCYVVAVAINPDCHPLNYINILLSAFVAAVQFHQRRKLLDKIQNQDEG